MSAQHAANATIAEFFAEQSPLADVVSNFSPRQGQSEMAQAVEAAIVDGENLVVEAGTGTGKTLAYLVPALLAGRRIIISTGTKNLQDQLFHRDLPNVCGALGRPATTVLLKGRSNYLCLHRLETARFENDVKVSELAVIDRWSRITKSGDIAEADGVAEDSQIWSRVTSTQDNCVGAKCDLYAKCHVVKARQAALEADIVVVNHHLLLADLVLKEEGFGELLPGVEAVIVDEAHQFPDVAQSFFNRSLTSRNLQALADDLRSEALMAVPPAVDANRLADRLLKAVADTRLGMPRAESSQPWDAVADQLDQHVAELILILDDVIDWLEGQGEHIALQRCLERTRATSDCLDDISQGDEIEGMRWVGLTRMGFSLNYTPVEVAESLRKLLDSHGCAWIFTSATVAVGENFGHFTGSVGLEDPRTLAIPSPFDYPRRGLLLLPEGMPEPAATTYVGSMLERVIPLVNASRGRAFLLFTSYRALREAASWLREQDDFKYPLLVQGEAPRSRLLEQFAELSSPVLLGTASFWEGVDIRGDQLVLVAIDKLPFASPGDPLLKARLEAIRKRGGNPFREHQLPQAILALKQGVGRLIRDFSDYGVVVVCDPRLTSRSYGRSFLGSLPPFRVTRSLSEACEFLEK